MVWGIGNYPPGYNPKVHGPYNPARYYGKPDMPLSEVKLGELGSWFGRRSYDPVSMIRGISRGYNRWAQTWLYVKRPGVAPFAQFCAAFGAYYYFATYSTHQAHRHCKYH